MTKRTGFHLQNFTNFWNSYRIILLQMLSQPSPVIIYPQALLSYLQSGYLSALLFGIEIRVEYIKRM